jgi:hypothetical protein
LIALHLFQIGKSQLVKEPENLSTSFLATGFFVVHNTCRSSQDKEPELTRRQQVVDPVFNVGLLDVEARRDHTTFIQATNKLNNNLS